MIKAIFRAVVLSFCLHGEAFSDSQGLVINSLDPFSNQIITQDTHPKQIRVFQPEINISSSIDQYSSARLHIVSKEHDLKSLTISFEPEGDIEISSITIDFHVIKEWYQATGAWLAVGKSSILPDRKVLVPELLLKDESLVKVDHNKKINYLRINKKGIEKYYSISEPDPKTKKSIDRFSPEYDIYEAEELLGFKLNKGVAKQVWVTIKTGHETKPGKYRGRILIKRDMKVLGATRLTLNVLPIELPEPGLEYSIYYHGRLYNGKKSPSVSSEYKTEEQLLSEFVDMREHGISYPVIYQDPFKSKKLLIDYLAILKQSRLKSNKLYMCYLNTRGVKNKSQLNKLESKFNVVRRIADKFDVDDIYVYGIDEARGEVLESQKPAWERVQSIGGKTFVAGFEGTFETMGDRLDLLIFAQSPMEEEARKVHSIGKKIFNYANPQVGVESPYVYRRNYGVQLWASGFDGAMLYAYQHFMGDGWNDFDHPMYRDHNFVYSASNAIIGTMAWEGFRAGVDDVRFITLLEKRIQSALKRDSNSAVVAQAAKNYLTNLKQKVNKYNRYSEYTKSYFIDLDEIRKDVSDYIMRLENK